MEGRVIELGKCRLRKVLLCLAGIIFSFGFLNNVNAVTFSYDNPWKNICYNATNPFVKAYEGTDELCWSVDDPDAGHDIIKHLGSNYAYCVNRRLPFVQSAHNVDPNWKKDSKEAIMAGYLVNKIASEGRSESETYAITGAALNHLFVSSLGESNAYRYDSLNHYITEAENYYRDNVILSNKLSDITITSSNKVLNYSESNYISNIVTVSGFKAIYGGSGVTYNITATASNGATVMLCNKANGTDCKNNITITNNSDKVSFYVLVSNTSLNAGDKVTLKVTGSNKSTYPSSVLYVNTTSNEAQKLLVVDNIEVERSISQVYDFIAPNLVNHTISGYKVDENGESLDGATLEIYKDDPNDSNNLLSSNNGSGSVVTYVSPGAAESDDDFFNHDYYLVEKSAPNGYVLREINKFYIKGSSSADDTSICYYTGEALPRERSQQDDLEHCNFDNYNYMCKSSDGYFYDLDSNGSCDNVSIPVPSEIVDDEEDTNDTETFTKVCYDRARNTSVDDESYCSDKENYIKINKSNGNLTVTHLNKKNTIRISKQAVTGDEEISGATLKVCTVDSYNASKNACAPAKTIDDVEMKWTSGDKPQVFNGVPFGNYYIIEETPPHGYVSATTVVDFSIDESGSVKTGDKVITNEELVNGIGAIVVKNDLSSIHISKQDMATSKELPGATLSICRTYLDEAGNVQMLKDQYTNECIEAILADGTVANWISTNESKNIVGLDAGTYYLVEKIAPRGYATSESIMFTLTSDGKLLDKDGNNLADNKLVMHDKLIEDLKTGSLSRYMIVVTIILMVVLGIGSYYYINKSNNKTGNNGKHVSKVRGRKIHDKI